MCLDDFLIVTAPLAASWAAMAVYTWPRLVAGWRSYPPHYEWMDRGLSLVCVALGPVGTLMAYGASLDTGGKKVWW